MIMISDKLDMLQDLMLEFFHIGKKESDCSSVEEFIAKTLDMDVETVKADMGLYNDSLDTLLDESVRLNSKLRDEENRPALLAMVVYSYKEDKDLDDWMIDYAKHDHTCFIDQEKSFRHMKKDFEKYCKVNRKST